MKHQMNQNQETCRAQMDAPVVPPEPAPGPVPTAPSPLDTPPSGSPGPRHRSETERVKRRAFARLLRIFGWLQEGRYPNCTTLARDLEVSDKTALRDLDCLRDEWALPIAYDQQRHGFYFTRPVERLPWAPVTEAELFALCVSSKVVELYQGLPFHKPLELAFAKLARRLDDEERYFLERLDQAFSFRPFAPEEADLRVLELVSRAVAESRELHFAYRKPGQKQAEARRVQPYHLFSYEGRMYLRAYDLARQALRTFVLGRIRQPALTCARFVRPKEFDPKQDFSASLGVMHGQGDYPVAIEMDAWLTDILRGRRWHASQQVEEQPDGSSRLRLRLGCLEEIEQYVLSWGTHARVLGPAELRQRLGRVGRALAESYPVEGDGKV